MRTITLSIKEISELKNETKTLDEIIKTHDGTSMGGAYGKSLKKFIEEYADDYEKHIKIYNSNNETLTHIVDGEYNYNNGIFIDLPLKDYKNEKDLHIISNIGIYEALGENHYIINGMSIPLPQDVEPLLEKNNDGEYLVRSNTIVCPDKSSLTLIKNNKFNSENEDMLNETIRRMNDDYDDFIHKRREAYNEKFSQLTAGKWDNLEQVEQESYKYANEKIGTVEDFLKQGKYDVDLEKCNVRFAVRKNR